MPLARKLTRPKRYGPPQIKWDAAAIRQLSDILAWVPQPDNAAIAAEMGCTPSAVQTAKSRYGLSARPPSTATGWRDFSKPPSKAKRVRECIGCRRPFGSEGFHNRICIRCSTENKEVACYGA
jgi:hypothetical protein